MRPSRTLRATLIAATIAVSGSLLGCAPPVIDEEESVEQFDEARTEVVNVLDAAQAVIGGDWESAEFGARPCTTIDGGAGAQVIFQRLGPPVDEATLADIAAKMVAAFADAGFEVASQESTTPGGLPVIRGSYPADGVDAEGFRIAFGVSPNGSTLDGSSKCVPGDANEINQQRQD